MRTQSDRPKSMAMWATSAPLDIEIAEPGRKSRWTLRIVCALFVTLVMWAAFAKLDIVAVAQGKLVPQTYVKIVQPAEAGIIRDILVREGDVVAEGAVLIRLDPTLNATDSHAIERELSQERMQLRRIEAELQGSVMIRAVEEDWLLFAQVQAHGTTNRQSYLDSVAQEQAGRVRAERELDAATELLKKLEQTLPSYERSAAAYEKLASDKLIGSLQAEERRREASERSQDMEAQRATVAAIKASIEERTQRLAHLRSAYLSNLNQQRLQSVATINRLEQQRAKLVFQHGLLELRAPQSGTVKDLATTTIGAVVQPGTVLLNLVPTDELLRAEVRVDNKDIGFVRVGQAVRIKLSAFPFQKYGMLDGTVATISADASSDSHSSTAIGSATSTRVLSFKALIDLQRQDLKVADQIMVVAPGMELSAEINQGKRTVLEYLLSPVRKVASEAATER